MEVKDLLKEHTDAVEVQIGALSDNVKDALKEVGFIKSVTEDLEQKLSRLPGNIEDEGEISAGAQFVQNEEVKSFIGNASGGKRLSVEVKAITSADTSGGALTTPYRDAPASIPRQRLTVRSLLTEIPVTTGSAEYPKQTARTNNAATVAEGALKPESEMTWELEAVPIRTIAHWVLASRQILDDAPQLQAEINNELLYQLGFVEDAQLLKGGGTGTDLSGIYTQATAFSAGSLTVTDPNKIDAIGAALLQNALADIPATGIVLHWADWIGICLTKDADGRYLIGNPQDVTSQRLFGMPVVATKAMTAGNFLVGDFRGSARVYDRMQARVEVSTEDSDNFRKNLCTLLVEERLGLAVKEPLGFTKGAFAAAITDLTS